MQGDGDWKIVLITFLAVCFDRQIIEYEKKGDKFEPKRTITSGGAKASGPASGVSGALQKFSAMGNQKKENLAVVTKQFAHLHKSLISSITIKGKDIINGVWHIIDNLKIK